ncbi:MAG: hypothetical protein HP491_01120 [Nitrospira sp.]|nr:hypothetical protein [Nitrospira sp.]
MSLIPLTSGILAGLVAVNSSFGFVHGITLGFGITLLGVVDDYPIHLFSHLTRKESAPATMRAIWPTMRLGIVTTAIGFSSLLLAGFPALAQLGLFALAGLSTAAVVTRWVLPVCVPAGFVPREIRPDLGRVVDGLPKARIVVPVVVILATIVLIWSDTPLWQEDLESLSPLSADKKELDQQLRQELGAPDVRDLFVVEGTTVEDLLVKAETLMPRLEQLREGRVLSGYDIVSRYLPSQHVQQERLKALPDREILERNLDAAQKGLPFKPGLFTPFVTAVDEARRQPPLDRETFKGMALGMKLPSSAMVRARTAIICRIRIPKGRGRFARFETPWPGPRFVLRTLNISICMERRRGRTIRSRTRPSIVSSGLGLPVVQPKAGPGIH